LLIGKGRLLAQVASQLKVTKPNLVRKLIGFIEMHILNHGILRPYIAILCNNEDALRTCRGLIRHMSQNLNKKT